MRLGGLDIGTTGCKLSVYDQDGSFVFNSYQEYEVSRHGGEHEIDAKVIFDAVCTVIKNTTKETTVDAIGVTTFGETFTILDENDNVLMPSMLYTDPRGEKECEEICEKLGKEHLTRVMGIKPHQMFSLSKMMWIKKNCPEIWAKTKRVLLMEDYIIYMLSGNAYLDYALATRSNAFDVRNKCWSQEILDAAGIDKGLLSKLVPSGTLAGNIRPNLAKELGLSEDTKIVVGAHDQVAAAVGAGVFEVGQATDGTGTVECITPVYDKLPENEAFFEAGYGIVPYVFDGTYVSYAFSYTGGAAIKWCKDKLAPEISYKDLDMSVKDEPTGILVLPHFAGAATPYMDMGSKAAMLGITLETTKEDIYKAIMEGVTYEIMMNIENVERCGIKPQKLFATGGGASSEVWLQIKADILNRPITALDAKEAGACGTCMLVGVAIGLYKDLYEAKKYFVREKKTFTPNPEKAKAYAKLMNAYRSVYKNIRPIIKETN